MNEAMLSILSGHTCGPACWEAREDVCRCECGGKNHGCLRTASGIQPVRRTKLAGDGYSLLAVGHYSDMCREAEALNRAAGCYYYPIAHGSQDFDNCVAKVRHASDSQVAKWPELAAYRTPEARVCGGAYLLWHKQAIVQQAA